MKNAMCDALCAAGLVTRQEARRGSIDRRKLYPVAPGSRGTSGEEREAELMVEALLGCRGAFARGGRWS